MSTCPNCGKKLSCGCQKTKAADGKICCNGCVGFYNKSLKQNTGNSKRVISNVTVTKRIISDLDSL
jgi:hypothetical protein